MRFLHRPSRTRRLRVIITGGNGEPCVDTIIGSTAHSLTAAGHYRTAASASSLTILIAKISISKVTEAKKYGFRIKPELKIKTVRFSFHTLLFFHLRDCAEVHPNERSLEPNVPTIRVNPDSLRRLIRPNLLRDYDFCR